MFRKPVLDPGRPVVEGETAGLSVPTEANQCVDSTEDFGFVLAGAPWYLITAFLRADQRCAPRGTPRHDPVMS